MTLPRLPISSEHSPNEAVVRIGECELNLQTRECKLAGQPLKVRRLVFDLIRLLIERRPATVTRAELLKILWKRSVASPSVIARVVLDARRCLGDDPEAPRHIVNVYGVGYRLATQVDTNAPPGSTSPDTALQEIRRLLADTFPEANLSPNHLLELRENVERARNLAVHHGFHLEHGRALCRLGWIATWLEDTDTAAGFISQALRIAHADDHPLLLAMTRVAGARLNLSIGETEAAMEQLAAAHLTLKASDEPAEQLRCEFQMARAAFYLRQWDVARYWGTEALKTAESHGMQAAQRYAEYVLITGMLYEGEYLEQEKAAPHVLNALFQDALQRLDALIDRVDQRLEHGLWIACVGNRCACLARLGRFEEARHGMSKVEALVVAEQSPHVLGTHYQRMLAQIELVKVNMSLREGRPEKALHQLEALLGPNASRVLAVEETQALELSVDVAEQCGRLDLALQWSRRLCEVQSAMQAPRAASRSRVLYVQAQQQGLHRSLDAARRTLYQLERQLADLRQRAS